MIFEPQKKKKISYLFFLFELSFFSNVRLLRRDSAIRLGLPNSDPRLSDTLVVDEAEIILVSKLRDPDSDILLDTLRTILLARSSFGRGRFSFVGFGCVCVSLVCDILFCLLLFRFLVVCLVLLLAGRHTAAAAVLVVFVVNVLVIVSFTAI